jgi:pentapeptide MXKDX repeat protein
MTTRIRMALGISAATLALGVAFAPAVFAEDPMQQDIDFRNGVSRVDGVRRDTVSRETRSRDAVKKDDRAKKDGTSK